MNEEKQRHYFNGQKENQGVRGIVQQVEVLVLLASNPGFNPQHP